MNITIRPWKIDKGIMFEWLTYVPIMTSQCMSTRALNQLTVAVDWFAALFGKGSDGGRAIDGGRAKFYWEKRYKIHPKQDHPLRIILCKGNSSWASAPFFI